MFRGLIGTCFAALVVVALTIRIGFGAVARRRAALRMRSLCTLCERPTQPDVDLYDDKRRTWYHVTCRQRFLDMPVEGNVALPAPRDHAHRRQRETQ